MTALFEIQRDDLLVSNFQFMKLRTGEIFRFPNLTTPASVNDFGSSFPNYYPRKNYVVHDENYNNQATHAPFLYRGNEDCIIINFKYLNMCIKFAEREILIYERYSKGYKQPSDSVFVESIDLNEFMKYSPEELQKAMYRFLIKTFSIHNITNKKWRFSLNQFTADVMLDIKNLIIREVI